MTAQEIDDIWGVPFDEPLTPAEAVRDEALAAARDLASEPDQ
jgi:hypothetical protein